MMRKSVFQLSILMLFAVVVSELCLAQANRQSFPIRYGSKNDGLPRRLKVRGVISRVDYAPPHFCGELVFPTTLEVRLDRKASGYKHPFVYLVVPCLYQPEGALGFLNQRIEINATKQYARGRPCFYDREENEIDSGGLPFYCADREELLKSVTGSLAAPPAKEPVEFEGTLEKGITYRALVTCDQAQEWRTVLPLHIPYHHAARIEWLNLREFPQLDKTKDARCQRRIVFQVVTQEIVKAAGQYRWNITYGCRIVAVEK